MDQNLRENSIRNLIEKQESELKGLEENLAFHRQEQARVSIQIELVKETIETYRAKLSAHVTEGQDREETHLSDSSSVSQTILSLPTISSKFTLEIIKKYASSQGLQIKDILEHYEKAGLFTHNRIIDAHLQELIKNDKILQTNPENRRGRKYRAIEDSPLLLSDFEF